MPTISYTKDGGVIRFDENDFLRGFSPQYVQSGGKKFGGGAMFMREADPFRNFGALAPGYAATDVATITSVTAVLRNAAIHSGSAYLVSDEVSGGALLHKLTLSTDTIVDDATWPIVTAAAPDGRGEDVVYVNVNTWAASANTHRNGILVSMDNGTNGFIGIYDLDTPNWDNNFSAGSMTGASSTAFKSDVPLAMHKSPFDGKVYITGGQAATTLAPTIASYDPQVGNYGTLSQAAFALPYGFLATSFSETENYLVIYAYDSIIGTATSGSTQTRGQAKAFFWNRVDSKATFVYDLKDNYVNGGFNVGGKIGCFTWGRAKGSDGKLGCIRFFDGEEFSIPENGIFSGNIPRHGGVEVMDDMITFYVDGKVFTYGTPWPGLPPALIHRASGGGTSIIGMAKNLSGTKLYISSGASTGQGLQTLSTNYDPNCIWQSTFAEPVFPMNMYGEVDFVRTDFATSASGGLSTNLNLSIDRYIGTVITVFTGITDVTIQTTAESSTSKRIRTETNQQSSGVSLKNVKFSTLGISIAYAGSTKTAAPHYSSVEIHYKNTPLPS